MSEPMPIKKVVASSYLGPAPGGGSRAQYFFDELGDTYVVKFTGNNQGVLVLVNELVAGRLAESLGAPSPEVALVEVPQEILDLTPEIQRLVPNATSGIHFGCRKIDGAYRTPPRTLIRTARNKNQYPASVITDKLGRNQDRNNSGNFLIVADALGHLFYAIDYGYCFGTPNWNQAIINHVGQWVIHDLLELNESIWGTNPFSEALNLLAGIADQDIDDIITSVPAAWGLNTQLATALGEYLKGQRNALPGLVVAHKAKFPGWT